MRWFTSLMIGLFLLGSSAAGNSVNLTIQEPAGVARTGWPVTSGIPIARGTMQKQDVLHAAMVTCRSWKV